MPNFAVFILRLLLPISRASSRSPSVYCGRRPCTIDLWWVIMVSITNWFQYNTSSLLISLVESIRINTRSAFSKANLDDFLKLLRLPGTSHTLRDIGWQWMSLSMISFKPICAWEEEDVSSLTTGRSSNFWKSAVFPDFSGPTMLILNLSTFSNLLWICAFSCFLCVYNL